MHKRLSDHILLKTYIVIAYIVLLHKFYKTKYYVDLKITLSRIYIFNENFT